MRGAGLGCDTATAADWPQWRGPTHDAISVETGLAESWPDSGPPVLWTKEIGKSYSSFIAVGDRVWTQTQTLYEQAVVCLDAETGEAIWSQRYGWPYDGGGLYRFTSVTDFLCAAASFSAYYRSGPSPFSIWGATVTELRRGRVRK